MCTYACMKPFKWAFVSIKHNRMAKETRKDKDLEEKLTLTRFLRSGYICLSAYPRYEEVVPFLLVVVV